MKKLKILWDAAHGTNVAGKRSPDGSHIEYIWSRDRINMLHSMACNAGYESVILITENIDPKDHLARINRATVEPDKTLLISLHNNAAGMGNKWYDARGYCVYTSPGQTKSDKFSDILYVQFNKYFPQLQARVDNSDGDKDWEARFGVLLRKPMSVLIEWLFQDNKLDVELLKDKKTNDLFCATLMIAINEFEKTIK